MPSNPVRPAGCYLFRTERQLLRELTPDDAAAMFELNLDPDVMRHIGPSPFETVGDARRFLEAYDGYARDGMGRWAAVDAATDEFLGWCGLLRLDAGEVDLGYRYRRAVWGRGLATEAANACVAYAFQELRVATLVAQARTANVASIRVMQKLGLRFRRSFDLDGVPAVTYALAREDHMSSSSVDVTSSRST